MMEKRRRKPPGPGKPAPARDGDSSGPFDPPQRRMTVTWIAATIFVFVIVQAVFFPGPREIPFSRFLSLIDQGQVEEVNISTGTVQGKYVSGDQDVEFTSTIAPNYEVTALVEELQAKGVTFTGSQPSPWAGLLFGWVLPFGFIGLLYYFFIYRRLRSQLGGGGGPLSLGKNKAKLYDRTDLKTTFNDVAGVDEVEAELKELVDYLKNKEKFERLGARIPKGVLLVGPPGTGKTLLARAVAGEASVPFYYVSASEFVELFVGLGAARVRDLFQQARERAPAIVFIDEIDSIGQARSGAAGSQLGSNQEQEQTLQQLLTEMDGFEPNSGVIIMAASNRPEVLDPALLRPGRFDRRIQVSLPDVKGRSAILKIHSRGVKLADDVGLEMLARRTPGFSGAQLANLINEGALLAARHGKDRVEMEDLEEAIDRVIAGLERRSQVLTDKERRLVAYHELGHAVVARFVENADPVHRISIIPRSIGALGYTQQLPEEERYLMSEPELRDRIAVLLGGRSAELNVFGFATTGAQDDLKQATEIARRMVMEFGMSESVGPINIAEQGPRFLAQGFRRGEEISDETEVAIDREVKAILTDGYDKAKKIVAEHRKDMDGLSAILLDKEVLDRSEFEAFFGDGSSGEETQEITGDSAKTQPIEGDSESTRELSEDEAKPGR